ncbi:MAG: DNA replication/repair protein RecF [Saprospiraceae bacterium]
MQIHQLKLTQFKNYTNAVFEFDKRLNCIVGQNGVGKTNLLDAIHYLAMCKSHFSLPDKNIIQHDQDFLRLEGHFQANGKAEVIVAKLPRGKKKVMERNGVPYKKLTEHIGLIPVVMIVPDDTRLATEGSELRRRFMDTALAQMDRAYLQALSKYQLLLKQRNAALKQMARQQRHDEALLQTYTEQMEAPAKLIFQKRKEFIKDWLPVFQKYYAHISGGVETVNCRYRSQLAEGDFMEMTRNAQEKDRILARTTIGVHKDDLIFEIKDYELKKYASQGQLKSYVLALKLALYDLLKERKEETPIFLLDDIFDKLDKNRVRQLLELLIEKDFGQVFISDTHVGRVVELVKEFAVSWKEIVVKKGVVKEDLK